ncbi:MAG: hypothetical protein LPH21_11425 [Shewanella sp.]|nr:hypothetical protein [Shewanella sp.]MCF1430951.1 hypothetical protein [Shewanella sp.]MCF1458129.1 hypothetical protein [Shewanella sp.]
MDGQGQYIVHFDFGAVEVGYSNLCPEASGELRDALSFRDFMNLSLTGGLTDQRGDRYYKIGYKLPNVTVDQVSTTEGCYVFYDSYGYPDCRVQVVDVDC